MTAAVLINVPFVLEPDFTSMRTMNLLTLYVKSDKETMATYERAHESLISAGLIHDMITYGNVGADFYDRMSPGYGAATWDDARERSVRWFNDSLQPSDG